MLEDQLGNPPNGTSCAKYAKDHKLTIPVVYDPLGKIKAYGGKETTVISDEKGIIQNVIKGDPFGTLEATIVKELQRTPEP